MATSRSALTQEPSLISRLAEARERTDALFDLLPPNSFYDRPIPERHRLIFYLGHLEAFDWNLLSGPLNLSPHDEKYDKLFAFGIDPVGDGLPTDVPSDWPTISAVEKYKNNVRTHVDEGLNEALAARSETVPADIETLLHVAIEHRLMHAETIAYLLHNLPVERKIAHAGPVSDHAPAPRQRMVSIPAGVATLGLATNVPGAFGWDNEFDIAQISVPSFAINAYPVTNAEYLRFVRAGGYDNKTYWKPEDWEWKSRNRLEHPHFWAKQIGRTGARPRCAVGIPGYVRQCRASGFLASLCKPCGGNRVCALDGKNASNGGAMASRSVQYAVGN